MKPLALIIAFAVVMVALPAQAADPTLLLRQPSLSKDRLAFVYAGDIWIAQSDGTNPRRLTAQGNAQFPSLSPDGTQIAYSANFDGNLDVYVMPVAGGDAKRLTFHPGPDNVQGWSRDGKSVLFASPRAVANNRSNQLYEVAATGGVERKVMEAVAFEGTWSPDGGQLAYRPYNRAYVGASGWRLSRGGTTTPLWIIDRAGKTLEKIPHVNATDSNPLWLGDEVIFISDRDNKAANLFAYSLKTKAVRQLTQETIWDVKSLGGFGTRVVYEVGGALKELDLAGGASKALPITLPLDGAQLRPQWRSVQNSNINVRLSPTGKRLIVSARGEIFTSPVKDGSVRNLTQTPGVREKDGLWSPLGTQIAYITEKDFQHVVVLRDQAGLEAGKTYPLPKPGYWQLLAFAPDGKKLALMDNHLALYVLNLDKGDLIKIDTSLRRNGAFDVAFSPDARYVAYAIVGANFNSRLRLYDLNDKKSVDLTDGGSDAIAPAFGEGDVLYFAASTNAGPQQVGLDLSSQERPLRFGLYAMVLSKEGKSPMAPKTADEDAKKEPAKADAKEGAEKADKADKSAKPTKIDLEGLSDRIVPLPVPERNYAGLEVAHDGALYYVELRQPGASREAPDSEAALDNADLVRFDVKERKAKVLKSGIRAYALSADGKKVATLSGRGKIEVADTGEKYEAKPVELGGLMARIDPVQEWRQIFDEAWWMERDFFYDPGLHGLDWAGVRQRYLPLLAHVRRREDLNQLIIDMIAEFQVGHNRLSGGDLARVGQPVSVGLLGADYVVENGRHRLKTIYTGDRWNPFLKAPLAAPGLGVKEGDYLIAVNGRNLNGDQNLYEAFENTAGKQTSLTIGADPTGKGAKTVVVEPVPNEAALRQWAWVERNRAHVDKKSGGKVAYVYLPNTAGDGFTYFNRMFFAQSDRQALIVDDRRNSGGQAANYVTEILGRPYLAGWKDRDGLPFTTPGAVMTGPKVMLIDQDAGSGGDFLPWAFKRLGLGPLIGTRTWGGLIGISANPPLIDDAALTVPFFRFYTPDGEWRVENEGAAPDMEVELDPLAVNRGEDAQLDAALAEVLKRLSTYKPAEKRDPPPYPKELGK